MAESRVKDGNYYLVQSFMVKDLKLKGLEKDIYAIIYGFSQAENQTFTGSLQYLSDWTNSTKQGILKTLNSLIAKGLIERKENIINNVKFVEYYTTEFNRGGKLSLIGSIKQSLTNNIEDNNIINNKEKENGTSLGQSPDIISISNSISSSNIKETEIFDYWNSQEIIKHDKIDNHLKAIKGALKENTVEQIKTYIDRYSEVIKDKTYYFDTKWTLSEFLKQKNAMNDFKDDGSKWVNYMNRNKNRTKPKQNYTEQRDYSKIDLNNLFDDLTKVDL